MGKGALAAEDAEVSSESPRPLPERAEAAEGAEGRPGVATPPVGRSRSLGGAESQRRSRFGSFRRALSCPGASGAAASALCPLSAARREAAGLTDSRTHSHSLSHSLAATGGAAAASATSARTGAPFEAGAQRRRPRRAARASRTRPVRARPGHGRQVRAAAERGALGGLLGRGGRASERGASLQPGSGRGRRSAPRPFPLCGPGRAGGSPGERTEARKDDVGDPSPTDTRSGFWGALFCPPLALRSVSRGAHRSCPRHNNAARLAASAPAPHPPSPFTPPPRCAPAQLLGHPPPQRSPNGVLFAAPGPPSGALLGVNGGDEGVTEGRWGAAAAGSRVSLCRPGRRAARPPVATFTSPVAGEERPVPLPGRLAVGAVSGPTLLEEGTRTK